MGNPEVIMNSLNEDTRQHDKNPLAIVMGSGVSTG